MSFKTHITIFIVLFLNILKVSGQNVPNLPFHLHNFNNYSLLNPAAAGLPPLFGIPEDPLFFFTHHRQQIGAFDNVPIFNSLSFNKKIYKHTPKTDEQGRPLINKKTGKPLYDEILTRNGWGGHLYNFSRSIWQTTGAYLSYSREVPITLSFTDVSSLLLGLSMGAENDGFKTDDPDALSDPAIVNRRDKFARPVGQFGAMLLLKRWEIGAGLPKLFKSSQLDNNKGFYPIQNYFVSLSRQIDIGSKGLYSKTMAVWRGFDNNTTNLEINSTLRYIQTTFRARKRNPADSVHLNHHWIGASYIQDYGVALIAGTLFYKTKLGISYSYKFNAEKAGFNKNPVHEIQLIYNLRKLSKIESQYIEPVREPEIDTTVYDDDVVMDTVFVDDTLSLPEIEEPDLIVHPDTLTEPTRVKLRQKKYINYVVVGAFVVKGNAERQVRLLKRDNNIDAKIRFRSGYYNVHVLETESTDDAEKVAIEMQKRLKDKTVWMLCVPKKPDKPDKKE